MLFYLDKRPKTLFVSYGFGDVQWDEIGAIWKQAFVDFWSLVLNCSTFSIIRGCQCAFSLSDIKVRYKLLQPPSMTDSAGWVRSAAGAYRICHACCEAADSASLLHSLQVYEFIYFVTTHYAQLILLHIDRRKSKYILNMVVTGWLRGDRKVFTKVFLVLLNFQFKIWSWFISVYYRSINKKKVFFEKTAEAPTRRSALPADGDELHKNLATKHLQTLIRDACRGGLADVEEADIFEQRIATLENVSQFSAALLEIFEAIPKK